MNLFQYSSTYVLTVNFVYCDIFRFLMSIIIAIINDTGYFIRISWLAEISVVSATLNVKINQHCTLQINTISSRITTLKVIWRSIYQCPSQKMSLAAAYEHVESFVKHTGQESGCEFCEIFKLWSYPAAKICKPCLQTVSASGDEPPAQTSLGTSVPKPAGL